MNATAAPLLNLFKDATADLTAAARAATAEPGDPIRSARTLRALAVRSVIIAVLHERAAGAGWDDVASRLGMTGQQARDVFGDAEARWKAGDPEPWSPRIPAGRPALIHG